MNRTQGKALLVVALTGLSVLAPGCGSDSKDVPETPPTPSEAEVLPPEPAQLRILHASPDAPAVDVYAAGNAKPLATRVAFGATTAYVSLEPGTTTVELRPTGAPADSRPLVTAPVSLGAGARWTVVAAGQFTSSDPGTAFRVLPLRQDSGVREPGQAHVRFVHVGVDAPDLGIDLGNDGSVEVPRLERFADSGSTDVPVPAGMSLQVGLVAGTPARRVTAFTVPPLPAGTETLIVATGLLAEPARAGNGFSLLTAGRDGTLAILRQNPVVYALHASPDAPAVDVFAGDQELVDGLSFGALSGPIQVPPGAYTLDVFGATPGTARPSGPPVVASRPPDLVAGERYLVVASGYVSPPSSGASAFTLLSFAEAFRKDPGNLSLRLVHAAPGTPAVDVGPLGAERRVLQDAPFVGMSFGAASSTEGLPLPPGDIVLGTAPTGDANRSPRARFRVDPGSQVGERVFAVATNPPADPAASAKPSPWNLQLLLVDTARTPWTLSTLQREP